MRVHPLVSDFFEWRWAPCVGLTAGSLAFVALALLLIPTQFAGPASNSGSANDAVPGVPPRAFLGASLPRSFLNNTPDREPAGPSSRRERPEPPPGLSEQPAPMQRGFSPVMDRPDPPPAPAPPPPAPVEVAPPPSPPLAPPPSNVVTQQPQQPDADGPRREITVQ